jgi:hypothetical protein
LSRSGHVMPTLNAMNTSVAVASCLLIGAGC